MLWPQCDDIMLVVLVVVSTDLPHQLQQQEDQLPSSSSSSSGCFRTVVLVTLPLCVAVLLTLAAVMALYALSARRRRMTAETECGVDRHTWLYRCATCRAHLSPIVTDDHCKSVQHLHSRPHQQQQQQQQLVDCADATSADSRYNEDARRPAVIKPSSPSHSAQRPHNHSESTLLLVARDAWSS